MAKITKDMTIQEIIEMGAEKAAPVFFGYGMGCLGCAMAKGETLEEACEVHNIDMNEIVEKLESVM